MTTSIENHGVTATNQQGLLPEITEMLPSQRKNNPGFDLDELYSMNPRARVLIVDDDPDIVTLLKLTLRKAGLDVAGALDAEEAIQKCAEFQPDIFLLDLMMPVVDGWEIFRRLRQITDAPVVIVSAKGQKQDIVRGLETGADDYVAKPFYPPEVVSRVRAVLRRAGPTAPITTRIFPDIQLAVDLETHEVLFRGGSIALSPKEFAVLSALAKHAPKPVAYQAIAEEVWGEDSLDVRNRIKWVIHRLRGKLGNGEHEPSVIVNRIGFGYQLRTGPSTIDDLST
ncbi:MAG: response regulator transcription factor [Anaerolineales bacterium]